MKVLLTRFGGIGDAFPVMVAARQFQKRGDEVTIALRHDGGATQQTRLFDNLTDYKFLDFKEVGPWKDRCVQQDGGWVSIQGVYKQYDHVVDFMNTVENNSTSPWNNLRDMWEHWQRSRSSNWVNWYDLHLSWCNFDPTKVPVEEKRPFLQLSEDECEKVKAFKERHKQLFVIHPFASSLARSWYQAKELVPRLIEQYPGSAVVFWNPNESDWDIITKRSVRKLEKLHENPLRESVLLVASADLLVSVDTGCSHIAEALGTRSLIIYSTVPAWTRNKYYQHQSHIDLGEQNPEYYTFSLSLGDPLRVKDGMAVMSEREKKIMEMWDKEVSIEEAMKELNTDAQGAELELKLVMGRRESWERQQSKALSAVTVDMVFNRIKELVP